MISPVRYQIFVSSTYEDLREERQQATQAILESGCFPSGMELFPASDDTQWELIKRVIEECDYYIVILAGRYGSIGPSGLSYTEMEYDYAVKKEIPVLGFVRDKLGDVLASRTEKSSEGLDKLDKFRSKVLSRTCRKYSTPVELGMAVMKSLMTEARIRPRIGWIRADQARSKEDIKKERELDEALQAAQRTIEALEREIRDMAVLTDEIPRETLAQDDDIIEFRVSFSDSDKRQVSEIAEISWNDLLKIIGPSMFGYIVRKRGAYGQRSTYPFQDDIEEFFRHKLIDRVQNRKIKVETNQIDSCIIQFKELGLIQFLEETEENGTKFRGITLTEMGERKITLLNTRVRKGSTPHNN